MRNTFKKEERLTNKKIIDQVFKQGVKLKSQHFFISYILCELDTKYPVRILISVPKKIFRKAVHRNKIKRIIREAYRVNKKPLYEMLKKNNAKIALVLIYKSYQFPDFNTINNELKNIVEDQINLLEDRS